ncbi:MAG: tetratricopeptide repeat protein [Deltaproteobacteria bacterium]
MKSTQRPSAKALALLALSLVGTPLLAQMGKQPEQRGGVPNSDTPYILVATFRSPDRQLGVTMADEARKRLQSEHSTKELYVIPKTNINNTLAASGYRADSALNASDLMELAKQLRGEQVLEGFVTKTANGVHVEPRLLMKTGQQTVTQPLPPVDARDPGDAAKQIERSLTEASKAIPSYKLCTNALRAAKYDDAVKAARAGLAVYANSNLSRLCLLSAYASQKAPADSIISVSKAIVAMDPTSMIALANLADAYAQKGDTAKAIETNLAIYKLDPSNTTIGTSIVTQLAQFGSPDKALPIIDSMLVQNPGDPTMLRQKWLLQLRAGKFKQAITTGEEYVKADTAGATLDYYKRQIGAAQQDSDVAMAQQLAAKASQKFPNDADLQLLLAQGYRKAGQLQPALAAARRAAQVDPKNTRTTLLIMYIQNDLNQPDSAMATAQKAIASGQSKDTIGQVLLANAGPAIKKAQDSKSRADWESALKAAQTVDAIAPSPQSKFYTGVAAFSIGIDALQNVQALQKKGGKENLAKACEELKVVEDNFATASMAMPAGGSVDKDAAGQILGNINTYGAYVPQFKKALKCK